MNTREQLFGHAIEVLASGACVNIVGDRGSGRTRMLERIRAHFLNRSWQVESVTGIASLSAYPLVALSLAGIEAARDSRMSALPSVVAELTDRLPHGKSLLVIDNWDDLDEVSWGAITSLNREHGIPFALTRLSGRGARSTPTGLQGSTLDPSFVVELTPLGYEELEQALDDHLGGPVEALTASRLYAKSGGNVGLALALADAGRFEHSLEIRNNQWAAGRDLWSPSLKPKMETLLEPLTPAERELLETLSLLGVADVETADKFADARELERLEALSLVELYSTGSRYLIGVRPPLLVEYFRHLPVRSRRLRILQAITDALELDGVQAFAGEERADSSAAQFVRLMQEQQRARLLTARSEWERSTSLDTSVSYLDALMESAATRSDIDEVFEATADLTGPSELRVRWLIRWAEHRAYAHLDPAGAICRLREEASGHSRLGTILAARAVEIENELIAVPDIEQLPEPQRDTDHRVAAAILRARAYVHTTRGEITASERELRRLTEIVDVSDDYLVASIDALNRIARADIPSVVETSSRSIETARSGFDVVAMRAHGEILALCAIVDGRYGDANRVLEELLALGQSSSRPPLSYLGLTIMGSVVAARQGHRKAAQLRLEDSQRLPVPDGPFPGQMRGWAEVQVQASLGNREEAAAIAVRTGDLMWERGARMSAALAYVTGLELLPDAGELDRLSARVRSAEGAFVRAQFAYVQASVNCDPRAMTDAASALWDQGRAGIALAAYGQAIDLHTASDDEMSAADVARTRDELEGSLRPGVFDAARFDTPFVQLSDRELEIAQLAASGLSNQQIADELVLSVRTVESHLLRSMRKARVASRNQLRSFLEHIGHHLG
ncbi:LuxR C-terminal-related transcriptional regulator [Leifsonia sp. NPDC058248]|uniref:LuxR C-terminal-related transcriptional regulator n=1 Tax=Leifsonia sp. NPDC058248 TaxID=3346402 RepID=UPI0036DD2EAD